jgi:hypothetical protein
VTSACLTLLAPEAEDFVELLLLNKIAINDLEILILCYYEQVEGAIQIYNATSIHEFYLFAACCTFSSLGGIVPTFQRNLLSTSSGV